MRLAAIAWVMTVALAASPVHAAEPPALARARALYNSADYDGAIAQASIIRSQPPWADTAALIMARAHLERFRRDGDPADLTAGREALATVRMAALTERDQVDLLVGLGQSLYLGDQFGAAAELFDAALARADMLGPRDRTLLLDWWATSLEREAQTRPADRRAPIFERLASRMFREIESDPGSAVANYWFAVALRGAGDLERAWDAAIAAWVRSRLTPATAETLRADLERFVTQALIPERARARPPKEQPEAAAALRSEWDLVKSQWP